MAPSPARLPGWGASAAGIAAVAVGLGLGELTGALLDRGGTLVSGVGSWFVNVGAGSLKNVAVAVFGAHDKAALQVGIVVMSLGIGAVTGVATVRRRGVGVAVFVGFGVFAAVVSSTSGPIPWWVSIVSSVIAAGTGIGTLFALLSVLSTAVRSTAVGAATEPYAGRATRAVSRRFAGLVIAAGALAVAAGAGSRALGQRASAATRRALAGRLPTPTRVTPVPARQPFTVDGVSPYVTPTADFYRIDTALLVPRLDPGAWRLRIDGRVDRPLSLTYADLLELATVSEPVTISCVSNEVGGDLVGNAVWQGVPLRTLLDRVGVQAGGTQVFGHSQDGFTAGFPTELALDGRPAMVVVGMNGSPLPIEHGFPARIVVAGLYGYVSAVKWLTRIELTGLDEADGFWIPRGWSKLGPIKTQSRIDVPRAGDTLPAGSVDVGGVAWAPSRGISRVEVRVDNGPWQDAELGVAASANTWVQWRYRWQAAPGSHTLTVRATDATGAVQIAARQAPEPNGATGLHQRQITIRAAG